MTSPLALAVLAIPVAIGLVAIAAASFPGPNPRVVERLGAWSAGFGVVVVVVASGLVARNGPVESPTFGWDGLGLSVRLDPLSMTMLAMISLLAVVIFRFSSTYLDGDHRHGVFLGRLATTIAAVEVLVVSGNLALLVVAWVATSLALHRLLVFYRDRPRAVTAARKKFIAARVGDLFLIVGATLLYRRFGTGDLEQIFTGARVATQTGWAFGTVELAAVCIVIAAMLKSAQFPTHGWLVEVMETPTPVSALLHAGVLNAGPFLAIRMAYVIEGARPATTLLIIVGGFTAVFASVVLLTQPSLKVVLGYSSAAHMGFMLMVCGMGFYPAALLHLVAHSFYKAHAFLSSGSAIDEKRAAKVALPRRLGSPLRIAGSALIALALYLPLALLWGIDFGNNPIVVAIGGILVIGTTQLVAPALDSSGPIIGTFRATGLALAVTLSFFTLEAGAHHLLADTVPETVGRDLVQVALILVTLVSFVTVVGLQILEPTRPKSARRRAIAIHLRNGLYANAL
ncbi:MAG TPA: proton-conducting transporter membrane subunit, partial [Dermatophilaceae bacterium]